MHFAYSSQRSVGGWLVAPHKTRLFVSVRLFGDCNERAVNGWIQDEGDDVDVLGIFFSTMVAVVLSAFQ